MKKSAGWKLLVVSLLLLSLLAGAIPPGVIRAEESRSSEVAEEAGRSSDVASDAGDGARESTVSGEEDEEPSAEEGRSSSVDGEEGDASADAASTGRTSSADEGEPAPAASADFRLKGSVLVAYTGSAPSVTIPRGVTEIGESAFEGNTTLSSVTAPEGLLRIGYRAFADCITLTSVTLPDSLKSIGNFAFQGDSSLSAFSVGSGLEELGIGVFGSCGRLSDISFNGSYLKPNRYIAENGGVYNRGSKTVLYAYLPGYAASSFALPDSVERIQDYAFYGAKKLTDVNLGGKLRKIPGYAFSHCSGLSDIVVPSSVSLIERKAFENCYRMTHAYIPPSVSYIAPSAFDGCIALDIEASADSAAGAFAEDFTTEPPLMMEAEEGASSGNDASATGDGAVSGASPEASAENGSASSAAPASPRGVIDGNTRQNAGGSPVTQSRTIAQYGISASIVEGGATSTMGNVTGRSRVLSGRAFIGMDGQGVYGNAMGEAPKPQSSVVFEGELGNLSPGGEETSADGAPDASAGDPEAREKWTSLPKYVVASGRITKTAFYGKKDLTQYDFTEGKPIRAIGELSFARSGLSAVNIPQTVSSIGYGAFYHADDLRQVSIPKSVEYIGPKAFAGTPWLAERLSAGGFVIEGNGILLGYGGSDKRLEIPEGVKVIGPEAFMGNTALEEVVLPDSLKEIGEGAFQDCAALKTVTGGNGVTGIADRAFHHTALENYRIPESVRELGLGAFAGVKSVSLPEKLPALSFAPSAERLANAANRIPVFAGALSVTKNGAPFAEPGYTAAFTPEGEFFTLSSSVFSEGEASLSGVTSDGYALVLADEDPSALEEAFGRIYGTTLPDNAKGFSLTLTDEKSRVPIRQLGKNLLSVTLSLNEAPDMSRGGLHLVTLDADGQLEALPVDYAAETGTVSFSVSHLSPFALYQNEGERVTVTGGTLNAMAPLDDTPATGDIPLDPRLFLVLGLFFAGLAVLVGAGKR